MNVKTSTKLFCANPAQFMQLFINQVNANVDSKLIIWSKYSILQNARHILSAVSTQTIPYSVTFVIENVKSIKVCFWCLF